MMADQRYPFDPGRDMLNGQHVVDPMKNENADLDRRVRGMLPIPPFGNAWLGLSESWVPIGSFPRPISAIENDLRSGATRSSSSYGHSVLIAQVEDGEIQRAELLEEQAPDSYIRRPLTDQELRDVLDLPAFQPSIDIANARDGQLTVDPGDDVVHVLDPTGSTIDLSDLPVYEPPSQSWIQRREDMRSSFAQRMEVIGQSADGTRVIGRSGAGFVSVSRDAFTQSPKYLSAVNLSRNGAGREVATIDEDRERFLGR